ncbi:hypothetical protein OJ253_3709 [Cryptosporidium canis]|uniref:SusD family protein n=1 Tax=Cryptosporidium canis TaxID=195482 RepID=A0A9D5DDP1_9CRYT|nr:hypothetical protein OJ253_3709 [Cryptosporidium canis]
MKLSTYKNENAFLSLFVLGVVLFFISCNKQDEWLDVKKNNSDVVPTDLQDFRALLSYDFIMNYGYPFLGIESSDNLYITEATWNSTAPLERNIYVWARDIYAGQADPNWNALYQKVAYANAVIDGLKKVAITPSNEIEYNNIKGSALFFRAYAFYTLSSFWAKPYDANTANTDLGIPLKLTSDVAEKVHRNSNEEVYNRIIDDVKEAVSLLPTTQHHKTWPSKPGALGFLARVYLSMRKYDEAGEHADAALGIYNFLYDFNTINSSVQYPFPDFWTDNKEVLFYAEDYFARFNVAPRLVVDSNLLKSYNSNDLRRVLFFFTSSGNITFQGTYAGGNISPFEGIGTNELYLIRAEAFARMGNKDAAIADLNTLMLKRWKNNGTWLPFTATDANDALNKILTERRKELPFTGQLRWTDLRRLNREPQFAVTLTRVIGGQTYTLPPNDPRYVFPIPDDEIRLLGIEQNPR